MSFEYFELYPVAGRIGAEIVGMDLRTELSDRAIRGIREALLRYKVIFFRNQTLDEAGHVAFARRCRATLGGSLQRFGL